jgi:homocysteine S-methyltransferase
MVLSGVKIIGGCCGSTPAHIRAMEASIRAVAPELSKVRLTAVTTIPAPQEEVVRIPTRDLSPMAAKLADGKFIYSVEMNPPRSPSTAKIIEKARELKEAGIDVVNIPDGPRASARLSAMVLAHLIKREAGISTILHYTCRDRNILGMQSDLLGAEALGLDNILCITGDPPKLGDYPMATAVFDVDAIGLLGIAENLNRGLDLVGNPINRGTTFHLGCGANPGAVDLEFELERLHRKIEAGAKFIMTQPVFDTDLFFDFLDRFNRPDLPVLVGILPLVSYRNAEFYHNEVPGMQVPEWIREKLQPIDDREKAAQTGIEIAAEALKACAPRAQGAYIMPPFGRVELALEVRKLMMDDG